MGPALPEPRWRVRTLPGKPLGRRRGLLPDGNARDGWMASTSKPSAARRPPPRVGSPVSASLNAGAPDSLDGGLQGPQDERIRLERLPLPQPCRVLPLSERVEAVDAP